MLKFPHCTDYHYFYIQIFVPYAKILKPLPGYSILSNFLPDKVQNPFEPCYNKNNMKTNIFLALLCILMSAGSVVAQSPIIVTETNFKLPILGEEFFYFGFAEGDRIVFSFEELSGKDLKEVEIIEFPSTSRYKEYKTKAIQNKTLTVPRTGIYQFRFANTVVLQKTCKLKIERIAASEATKNFNSTVYWRTVYDTTYRNLHQQPAASDQYKTASLLLPTAYHLDANTAGGESQVIAPISLPDFSAEWYYKYTVVKNKEQAEMLKSTLDLKGTLTKLITEKGNLSFSADSMLAPAGVDTCRIYLLDESNQQMFESKSPFRHFKEGTREKATSGVVKIKTANFPNAFLGIKNPNAQADIYVVIEAVAIISPDDTIQTAETQSVSVKARKEPFLKN